MTIDKTTPLKQIDCVLHFMANDRWEKDANGIDRSPKQIQYHHIYQCTARNPVCDGIDFLSIFDQIIDKLHKDGHIHFLEVIIDQNTKSINRLYHITFEGILFSLNGGYLGQYNRQNEEKNRIENIEKAQRDDERKMRYLTKILAFFAGIMAFFELMKMLIDKEKNYAAHCMELVTVLLLFLVGMGAGIFLYKVLSKEFQKV